MLDDRLDRLAARSTLGARPQTRRELVTFLRRLALLLGLIVALVVAGTIALSLVEGVSGCVAFVWALDTVSTVGSIRAPDDTGGQVVFVILIVLGVGTLFYSLVTVTEFFVAGHLGGLLE